MRIPLKPSAPGASAPEGHLTYCTNVHPGESWAETRAAIERWVPSVRERACPDAPFGVGLRLSARAAEELAIDTELSRFASYLAEERLYVFTINGFPQGNFHGERVKERVYRPDWSTRDRLEYSNRLAVILAALIPEDVGTGSVSTVPLSFRGARSVDECVEPLLAHALHLSRVEKETGRTLTLALEPEPFCELETCAEAAAFFERTLFAPASVRRFAALASMSPGEAERTLRRHLGLCLDACHLAVWFESPRDALDALERAAVRIAKVQVTTGLRITASGAENDPARLALARFAESTYLHQTKVRRESGEITRYLDLPEALAREPHAPGEWRVHFHVPIWMERIGVFGNTQTELSALFTELAARDWPCRQLEVETYTWDVIPEEHRPGALDEALARELAFVREVAGE